MHIRRLRSDDVAGVREIDLLSFPLHEQYDVAFYEQVVSSPNCEALVAVSSDGAIGGWILADCSKSPVRIRSLAVHPRFRRNAIGRALMTAIVDRHYPVVDLLVAPENEEALRLYRQLGFLAAPPDPEMPHRLRMIRMAGSADASIREERPLDLDGVRAVHDAAFGGTAEGRLVDRLREDGLIVSSVVAIIDECIVASAVFCRIAMHAASGVQNAIALAPVAVAPDHQRRGLGGKAVRFGLGRCADLGYRAVFVLGDPAYYSRFGFSHDLARRFTSPYSGAGNAWMALHVPGPNTLPSEARVVYPDAFRIVD